MINYQEITENLSSDKVIELMTKLGADRYEERDNYIIFPTICHNIDANEASMKLYFYKDTHVFVCYTGEGTMSIFKLLKTYYETREIEYNWYDDIYQLIIDCSTYKPNENFNIEKYQSPFKKGLKRKISELDVFDDRVLETFVKRYTPEWLNDGITRETMDKYNILYSISQNKIIIPHYDPDGYLVGIRGRALDEYDIDNFGKYGPVKVGGVWYKHPLSLNLYGLNMTKENIRKTGIAFLGEAEKFVLQLDNFSIKNCGVAVCGSNFNKYQLNLLMEECHPKEIVICFDKEELPGETKYFNKLLDICHKYQNYCNFSFIYDTAGLLCLKDSPTDRGEATFKQLLERRIRVK